MWIFGQVWFACLVGFVAGVLLDWMLRVRPLSRRVAELESHELGGGEDTGSYRTQHTPPRQVLSPYGSDADRPGRSASTIGGSTSLSDLLDPPRAAQPPPEPTTTSGTTTDPFQSMYPELGHRPDPWQSEPAEDSWRRDATDTAFAPTAFSTDSDFDESTDRGLDRGSGNGFGQHTADSTDQEYLEYLRAGAASTAQDEDTGEREPGDRNGHDENQHGDLANAGEVTTILPPISDDGPPPDAEPHTTNGYDGYSYEYGQDRFENEDFSEPPQSTPLPSRSGHVTSPSFTPFADAEETELSDGLSRGNELTPISESGFQPFSKPAGESDAEQYENGWIGDSGPVSGGMVIDQPADDAPSEIGRSANRTSTFRPVGPGKLDRDADDDGGWFDRDADQEAESVAAHSAPDHDFDDFDEPTPAESNAMTQRIEVPIQSNGSDFTGGNGSGTTEELSPVGLGSRFESYDYEYDEADSSGPARSLFEPVIDPDAGPGNAQQSVRQVAPHPVRVRTGVDSPPLAQQEQQTVEQPTAEAAGTAEVTQPSGAGQGWQAGPFGPGSALPLADGSAPTPDFRIKARTSSMVFHTESSPFYERLEPQVWFRDAEDAQRAGFTSWERPRSW